MLSEHATVCVLCNRDICQFWKGSYFFLVALQYLLKHLSTQVRTADGCRGSASSLACFSIPYMLQASSCSISQLSRA